MKERSNTLSMHMYTVDALTDECLQSSSSERGLFHEHWPRFRCLTSLVCG